MDLKFRKLKAEEIEVRVGSAKESFLTLLLYKDARVDQNILDETVGPFLWQRDHKELKGNIYCGVGIYNTDAQQWVWKWDAGAESNTEAVKGEASDSFKRASFNWGIGRELYTSPFIYLGKNLFKDKYDKFEVTRIGYDDAGNINDLQIKNLTTKDIVFDLKAPVKKVVELITKEQHAEMVKLEVNIENVLTRYKIDNIMKLAKKDAEFVLKVKKESLSKVKKENLSKEVK